VTCQCAIGQYDSFPVFRTIYGYVCGTVVVYVTFLSFLSFGVRWCVTATQKQDSSDGMRPTAHALPDDTILHFQLDTVRDLTNFSFRYTITSSLKPPATANLPEIL
jgi:hypothetical protein